MLTYILKLIEFVSAEKTIQIQLVLTPVTPGLNTRWGLDRNRMQIYLTNLGKNVGESFKDLVCCKILQEERIQSELL